ncbi:MAG: ribonuclease HI family protein [Candidatus Margulisbacteria bacterium]|nr:ribonuclease HI family protein [Candidatus Margulisiibacteriota bacterium]MBU1022141.1 ribonuclease HI family protein [Candidatus Margulisiibacteriota bacterium]MBU1729420.1 ribonuclease HI family protein [Candidatus Margulisiibacteriota bacterium]MBU1955693.1 ribonuclease HI family protein [Candidatus Margulisiibacteriota bacterium]
MSKKIVVFTDGASRGNPGESGIGVVIKSGKKNLLEISAYIGTATNNIAEYMAFIRGLEETLILGHKNAEFCLDSELLVKQIQGEYKVKNEGIKPLYLHAKNLISKFKSFSITHVRREANKEADQLANKGIDEQVKSGLPLFSD